MEKMDKNTERVRTRGLAWMCFVVGTDLLFMIFLLLFPNSSVYDLAVKYKWGITPSWAGTTIAPIIAMAVVLWNVIKKENYVLLDDWYILFTIISLVWVVELVVYEPFIGAYHWTKVADAIRWFSFWYASYCVHKIDSTAFVS